MRHMDNRDLPSECGRCGRDPAEGFSAVHGPGFDLRLCHPDAPDLPDCYVLWQREDAERNACTCDKPTCVRCLWRSITVEVTS